MSKCKSTSGRRKLPTKSSVWYKVVTSQFAFAISDCPNRSDFPYHSTAFQRTLHTNGPDHFLPIRFRSKLSDLLHELIVAEVIDEERGSGDEGARESGASHIQMVRDVLHVEAGK